MPIPGHVDYKRRAYCKEIKCPVQMDLDCAGEGTAQYERLRNVCKSACRKSAYDFHHWLIQQGYVVVKPE